jgi:hypothetical protein
MANKIEPIWIMPFTNGGAGAAGAGSIQLTSTGTSVNAALPTDSTGARPKYIYVQAANTGYFRLTVGAGTAVVTDVMVTASNPIVMHTSQFTFANFISDTGTVKCNVSALEMA